MFRMLMAVVLLVALAGCASHKASLYTVDGQEVFLGWNDQSKLPANSYYALIEGDTEGQNWAIKEIYGHPIYGRSSELQEVLFIDKEFRYVQPFFEVPLSTLIRSQAEDKAVPTPFGYRLEKKYYDRGSWECGIFMKEYAEKYTPCTSRLTKTDVARSIGKNILAVALTAGVASGTHKVVDKEKILEIVKNTSIFEQIRKSNVYKASAQ